MTQRILDIAVAGCGPAGLGVALMLHRAGHRVALFHQFEQPGAVGSGLILQPTGLAVLAELGLAERILGLGQRIDRLFGRACPSQRIVLDVDYAHLGRQAFGVAVHRGALFTTLYEAALRAGLAFETGWRVAGIERLAGSRTRLVRADGTTAGPFDLVIDALGTRSALRPAFGAQPLPPDLPYGALWASLPWDGRNFDPHALEQRYERASVMVGVLPIGRTLDRPEPLAAFFWSLKPAAYEAWQREGLAAWKSRIFDLWPETLSLLDRIQDPDALTLARYTHHTLKRPVAEGLAAIGDAAHAASPQLGQGANMALLDARALCIALEGGAEMGDALATYARLRRWHVRLYQALSYGFTPFYQSDGRSLPWLRDRIAAPMTRMPGLRALVAAMVAGTVVDPRRSLGLPDDHAISLSRAFGSPSSASLVAPPASAD